MPNLVVSLLTVTLVAGPLFAQRAPDRPTAAPPAAPVKGATVEGITQYRVANGLKVPHAISKRCARDSHGIGPAH